MMTYHMCVNYMQCFVADSSMVPAALLACHDVSQFKFPPYMH
jgi:hypothetical protein